MVHAMRTGVAGGGRSTQMQASGMMTISTFERLLDDGRAAWDALLARVPAGRWTEAGATGVWTLKDLVAHIAWGEEEVVHLLRTHDFSMGSGLWLLEPDERNRMVYMQRRRWPLDLVIGYEAETYANLRSLLVTLDTDDLNLSARFASLPHQWRPWHFIASNTFGHYDAHAPGVEAWLRALV
jgi:hypothetical protein